MSEQVIPAVNALSDCSTDNVVSSMKYDTNPNVVANTPNKSITHPNVHRIDDIERQWSVTRSV